MQYEFLYHLQDASCVGCNPWPPASVKPKHYRLAGKLVGKALYESAMGDTYRLSLNAQLCRSLLAQVGASMNIVYCLISDTLLFR